MAEFVSTSIVYVCSFVLAFIGVKWYKNSKTSNLDPKRTYPPCLPHLPIIGSLHLMSDMSKMPSYFMKKSKELGGIIAFYMCNRYVIVLNGRKAIHEALVKHSINFSSRIPIFFTAAGFNPDGRGITEHPYNKEFVEYHRISVNILKEFGYGQRIMESRITVEVEQLVQRIKNKNNQSFDPSHDVHSAVANVVSSILYGKRWEIDDPNFQEGIDLSDAFQQRTADLVIVNYYPFLRFFPPFSRAYKNICAEVARWSRYVDKILEKVLHDNSVRSFCNVFIEEVKKIRKEFTETDLDQLKYTVRDLFMAGEDTTAKSILWFIYFMANYPNVQKELRDEIDRVVGQSKLPSLDDKDNLPLLEAAILELMRIKTLAPLAFPHITLNETVVDGIFIPKDVMVLPNIYSVHMDPDIWDEPEKFKIERFLNEEKTKVVNRNSIIPFSLGKRSCIGELLARQELFLFTSALIQQFEILPPEGQDKIEVEEKLILTITPSQFEARLIKRIDDNE